MLKQKKKAQRNHLLLVAISTMCLLTTSCNNNDQPSKEEPPTSSNPAPSSIEETYNIVRPDFTPDYDNYEATMKPFGFNMTYYSDVYSRGFAWFTNAVSESGEADESAKATELYLVQSDKGEQADFSNAKLIEGTSLKIEYNKDGNLTAEDGSLTKKKGSSNDVTLNLYSHKVHVENLEKGKAYSYKAGSEAGYTYGAFIVEKENAKSITAIHMSDAQTKDNTKLNVWRNTFTNAVKTAGKDLDMALYNGDQFDQNNSTGSNGKPSRVLRHTKAIDVISDYKFDIPYMASSGNHEPSVPYINYLNGDINYDGFNDSGCYYSYDYGFAHFVVLNANDVSEEQMNWLEEDLHNSWDAQWKIVMMHISPYSTGDHSVASANRTIVEKLTPIFSSEHVDLVLQAHDHTYNKTLPYKWDAAGYTTTWNNDEVVNFTPETETKDNRTYDKNPKGTYYVTTGAAGHRCGAPEASDGIYAEVVKNDAGEFVALNSSKTYRDAKYKMELGTIKYDNQYEPYTTSGYTSDQHYEIGDLATGCVNAQMFGVLNLTENTLSYDVYTTTVEDANNKIEPKLFDSLDILKN